MVLIGDEVQRLNLEYEPSWLAWNLIYELPSLCAYDASVRPQLLQ